MSRSRYLALALVGVVAVPTVIVGWPDDSRAPTVGDLVADEDATTCPLISISELVPIVEDVLGVTVDEEAVYAGTEDDRTLGCGFTAVGDPVLGVFVRSVDPDGLATLIGLGAAADPEVTTDERARYERLLETGSTANDGFAARSTGELVVMVLPGPTSGFFGGVALELHAEELTEILDVVDPIVRGSVVANP